MRKRVFLFITFLCSAAVAQDLPQIAVYVTGDVADNEKSALGTHILATLVNSGRYNGIERSASFLAEIEKEHIKQRSGAIDDSQIGALGKQFGVKFVCIAAITPALGSYQVSARIINVETAEVAFIGEAASPLKTMNDLADVSNRVVRNMFGEYIAAGLGVKPKPPKLQRTSFWIGTGLDIAGAGLIAYGWLVEDENVKKFSNEMTYGRAEKAADARDLMYAIGVVLLFTGITVQILF